MNSSLIKPWLNPTTLGQEPDSQTRNWVIVYQQKDSYNHHPDTQEVNFTLNLEFEIAKFSKKIPTTNSAIGWFIILNGIVV